MCSNKYATLKAFWHVLRNHSIQIKLLFLSPYLYSHHYEEHIPTIQLVLYLDLLIKFEKTPLQGSY
jgi:hypothetical protein